MTPSEKINLGLSIFALVFSLMTFAFQLGFYLHMARMR
jgi:hypothetical protein